MSLSREENLKQLRKVRKISKGTDIGDKINKDLNKKFGSKNITFKNQLDSHIDTWEEHTKKQREYLNKKSLKTFEGFNEELKIGIQIEKEHGDLYEYFKNFLSERGIDMPMTEDEFAEKIARAHLREMKDYYTKLIKMEGE